MSVAAAVLPRRFYPEIAIGGFSHVDGSIAFYSQIAALLQPDHRVLDYGAGRGEPILDDPCAYRRSLLTFKGRCARVDGCDIGPAVRENPFVDHAEVIDPAAPLPYADASFDIIVSRYVFEHVANPDHVAHELLRVVKPGGWICAVTPNTYGYVALAARLVSNRRHAGALTHIQPGRKVEDVFPTVYALNSRRDLVRHFGYGADVFVWRDSAEPAYYFDSAFVFAAFKLLHKLLPTVLQTQLFVFMRRRS